MRFRVALPCLLTAILLAPGLLAAEIGVKSLSGPPEEFSVHRLPSAEETQVPTNLLFLDGGLPTTGSEAIAASPGSASFSASAGVGFSLVQVTNNYPNFNPATLTAPNGARFDFNGSSITCSYGPCGAYEADMKMEAFSNNAPGGVMTFSISGGEVTSSGSWNSTLQPVEGLTQVDSVIAFDENTVQVGLEPDPCIALEIVGCEEAPFKLVEGAAPVLTVSFADEGSPGRNDDRSAERRLTLTALRTTVIDGATEQVVHQEDFSSARVANLPVNRQGHTLVQLPSLAQGYYSIRLDVAGHVEGLGPIERTAFYPLPILAHSLELNRAAQTEVVDAERLRIELGVESLATELSHVFAYAEVWSKTTERPIAWIGGMTYPREDEKGDHWLSMMLDGRWLALAGEAGGGLSLRNLRIQDPDTFLPLDFIAELPLSVRQLPAAAFLEADAVVQDDTLLFGKGDLTIPDPDGASSLAGGTEGAPNTTGIFLVHGWCSGPAWPTWHFNNGRIGGTEVFADFGASRSHDSFARRIRDQGDPLFSDSFSVVAHSQGGAAATHLRAHYTSGLDNSTAPRRIQTMGTPYGGSTLMNYYVGTGLIGWLVSEIFGLCGQQWDLTSVGSAFWRGSIPNSVRSQVYYYRTRHRQPGNFWQKLQFWRWKCNAASYIIGGSDDGVVSTGQSSFSGARDMGLTDGECHTGGMKYVDQRINASRNDTMDRLGRPQPRFLRARCNVEESWQPGGYNEYWVDASSSSPGNFPITTYTFDDGYQGYASGTNPRFGPLIPGLFGNPMYYDVTVTVRDTSGATDTTICLIIGCHDPGSPSNPQILCPE